MTIAAPDRYHRFRRGRPAGEARPRDLSSPPTSSSPRPRSALPTGLADIDRRFPVALDLGCRDGVLARVLAGRGGIECLVQADPSPRFARAAGGGKARRRA